MARRSTPGNIYTAHKLGLRNQLRDDEQLAESFADALVEDWEAEAARRGLERLSPDFWRDAVTWIYDADVRARVRTSEP
jgi:hypothetical protein